MKLFANVDNFHWHVQFRPYFYYVRYKKNYATKALFYLDQIQCSKAQNYQKLAPTKSNHHNK